MTVKGASVAYCVVGGLVLYSGMKGTTISDTVKAALKGKLAGIPQTEKITYTGNPNATEVTVGQVTGTANGVRIANDSLTYQGHTYKYGGIPGTNGTNPWDCSSFVNWVLGHDFSMTLPGNVSGYNGSNHGPVADSYASWSNSQSVSRSGVLAGDLMVWQTHIGIALNNSQMISALNPGLGTAVTGIEQGGPQNETLICRRIYIPS